MNMIATGRQGAQQLGMARIGFGAAGLVAPKAFGRMWVGQDAASSRVAVITRAFAIRDLALGLGALVAVQKDAPVRGWIEAGLLCDLGDVLSGLRGPLPRARKLLLTSAALAAVAAGVLSLQESAGPDQPAIA